MTKSLVARWAVWAGGRAGAAEKPEIDSSCSETTCESLDSLENPMVWNDGGEILGQKRMAAKS